MAEAQSLLALVESLGIGNFILAYLVIWGTRFISSHAGGAGRFFSDVTDVAKKIAADGIPVVATITIANTKPIRVTVVDAELAAARAIARAGMEEDSLVAIAAPREVG